MNVRHWIQHPFSFARRVWYFFYERAHPTEPFLAPAAIRFLDSALPRNGIGLEWGSGRSTQWFAPRLRTLVAVEHDANWYEQVRRQLGESLLPKVDYRLIPLDHPPHEPTRPVYHPVPHYVAFVEEFPDEHFDFIEIDGHYRQACVIPALRKLRRGGLLLVDDTNWLPIEEWGVPATWPIVHQSVKINTVTSIWQRPSSQP
ncbi:MAG TPA: class I SAM-dependent methyltransferase [Blastocatellia bacterium]|nr:class I SAM-dependent methyltransferase [Blastocatellia bacterium]